MAFEDMPIFSISAQEINTLTGVVEAAQLLLLAEGAYQITRADERLRASTIEATKTLRSIVTRMKEEF